jgi:LysM repeat protein
MATDNASLDLSDQDISHPDQPTNNSALDHVWEMLKTVCHRARKIGALSRLVLHFGFLPAVFAGLLLGRAIISPRPESCVAATSSSQPCITASLTASLQGGIGGELADVLLAAVVPHTTIPRRYRVDPITYTVEPGDSVSSIAEQFGVSMETILWANGNLEDNPDYLADGDVLIILPVSGVYHTVAKGETLESIAQKYKVQVKDITSYEGNYMSEPYTIREGQKLIIPGGRKPYQVRHVVAWSGLIPAGAKRGTGQFGWPISGFISQGYSEYHRAIDIAAPKGTPIKAADSGYVAVVGRSDKGYGLYVLIDHGNGFQTLYGHFSVIYVEVGQSVGKGQTIGLCGSTGKSTGPHLHFELKLNGVNRNPRLYLK